jgi:Leucine-rich repeat (LRR) protein
LSTLSLWGCGLHGKFPDNIFLLPNLEELDLTYNDDLTGSFPSSNVSNVLWLLGLTRTRISVSLENDFFNHLKLLEVLVLRNSYITRSNLSLIGDLTHLTRLDLAGSNLSGQIPSSLTNLVQLQSLYLDNNNFSGRIPAFLGNCTTLQILDLSHNKIEDTFPYFLETLPELYILVLKSNKLHGFVNSPTTKNSFSKLRVFDISNNNLSGPLPIGYFNSFEAMMAYDQNPFYMMAYSIKVTWKGVEIEFEKIQSTLRILDLSNNSFTGEIPKEIGKLKAVRQLNLSHNSLTGHIQSSLGMFTNLESLDLSSNLLTGRIPVQLADLTFLAVLDLSHNKLEGPVPGGKQFNTFNASSFEGNLDLCGFPMPKECNNDEAPPLQPSNFHDGDDSKFFGEGFGWKAVAIGYGSGFVFGVTMGYVVFRTRKPAWFLKVVEDQWNLKARRTKKNARRNGARRN